MSNTLQKDVPFDQYSRQFQVAAMINALRHRGQTFKILDVGGYKGRTADFFPDDEVIVLDVFDVDEPNYIKGDGSDLPFADATFDFVVNFDVLEHIPSNKRQGFINECIRVASRATFFSAPHKTAENAQAEEALNALYKELHKKDHRWLHEHIAYGLPDFERVEKDLQKQKLHTVSFPSNDTFIWELMQGAIFLNSKFPLASPEIVAINEYYNEHFPFDGGESLDSTYRLILMVARKKQDRDMVADHFSRKNRPLNLAEKLDISQKIHHYQSLLLRKMGKENSNLRAMYEHEASRAAELHSNGEKLWSRIAELEAALQKAESRGIKDYAHKKVVEVKQRIRPNNGEQSR